MSGFEKHLAYELFKHEEIDWEEDRVTLRILSNGNYSPEIEAQEWGKLLASISSNVIGKLLGKYGDSEVRMLELYKIIEKSFASELQSELSDLTI